TGTPVTTRLYAPIYAPIYAPVASAGCARIYRPAHRAQRTRHARIRGRSVGAGTGGLTRTRRRRQDIIRPALGPTGTMPFPGRPNLLEPARLRDQSSRRRSCSAGFAVAVARRNR